MSGIVWLASYPKSGNTWLRSLLYVYLQNPEQPPSPNDLNKHVTADSTARWYLPHTVHDDPRALTVDDTVSLKPSAHQTIDQESSYNKLVKTHSFLGTWNGQPLLTMEYTAGAIAVIRNPLDVAPSFAAHFGITVDAAIAHMVRADTVLPATATQVHQPIGSWDQHALSWIVDHPRLCTLRYEDMLNEPEDSLKRAVATIGIEPDPNQIRKAINFTRFDQFRTSEETEGFVERYRDDTRFFRRGTSETWRDELNEQQVVTLVRRFGAAMEKLGYMTNELRALVSAAPDVPRSPSP